MVAFFDMCRWNMVWGSLMQREEKTFTGCNMKIEYPENTG